VPLVRAAVVTAIAWTSLSGPVRLPPGQAPVQRRPPDVIFVPSSDAVIDAMLKIAAVTRADVLYDLGCGDGRIVVTAAARYGARGVGIDIDPQRIAEANARAREAGVADKVRFFVGDIFSDEVKIGDATVVTLYLLPSLNERLRPKLFRELRPGTRVVSNSFSMGDAWPPDKTQPVEDRWIYFWTIPKRSGQWYALRP
jgi:SAM-dependent methyltransferase